MQDFEQLPLEKWAEQLEQARIDAGLGQASMAQTLRLSNAQLRGLESGNLSAFHGPGYYLRAVEKYARELNITLDPPVTELRLTDSQIALNRVKNHPSAAKLANQESLTMGNNTLPRSGRRSSLGIWLAVLLITLIGAGTWLAVDEGWPVADPEQTIVQTGADASTPPTTQAGIDEPSQNSTPTPQPAPSLASSPQLVSATETITIAPSAPGTDVTNQAQTATTPATTTTITAQATANSAPIDSSTNQSADPRASQPEPEPTSMPVPDVIQAEFTADCWVEVRLANGDVEQGIYKPGQVLNVTVSDMDRLTFGNAQAVTATRAGKPFDVNAFTRAGNNVARISARALPPASQSD